jgi:glucose dehydrogenase
MSRDEGHILNGSTGDKFRGFGCGSSRIPVAIRNLGNFIAWDARSGKIVWSLKERFAVWSGALATAGGVVFYGALEGYLKAIDAKTGKELYRFRLFRALLET